MTYATEIVQEYRLALRHIWNVHFWADQSRRHLGAASDFEALKMPLFLALVAKRLAPDLAPPEELFGRAYHVVPPVSWGADASMPAMIVESGESPGRWEEMKGPFAGAGLRLVLLDLFDWDVHNWRDFRYFLVRIETFREFPKYVGSRALVDVMTADVLWEAPAIIGLP